MRHLYKNHPLPLLLYLEWSLLAMTVSIVCFALLHNPFLPLPRRLIYANVPKIFNWLSLILVILLGLMGLRLPLKNFSGKILYILGNFALIWLIICLFGRGERIFPPLLLIVVIRSCLMFGWRGRIIVALTAYVSFCTMGLLAFYRIAPLGIPLTRPILPRLRRLQPEITEGLILNWIINSAILFGLALLFVLLLVGTLLAEKKSREKLAQVNHRLRQYALMIEDQATLQERNRIAREIHDSVGHALTAQSIQLENAALFWQKEPEKAKKYLENARHLGKDALKNVRQSVATLRSNPLARRSLPDALSEIIKELQSHTDITVDYKIGILSNLTPEVKNTIYRVIQEAFTNITKHAEASEVKLYLEQTDHQLNLVIADNGKGFEIEENTTGFGLQGMQERILAIGGNLEIISQKDSGCRLIITIKIPVERK